MTRDQNKSAEIQPVLASARPRLAFYIHSMTGGGAERVAALVASGFAARGYPVDLVMNRAEGPHKRFVTPDVRCVSLDCSTARAAPRLLRYLRQTRPDCLIAALGHNNLNAVIAARLTGTPFAATVHAIPSVHRRNLRTSGVIGTIAQILSPLIYRAADAVGVVSDSVRQDIAYSAKRPDKFHVLHNPVDTQHFSPASCPEDARATDSLAHDGAPIVLGVGRFDRAKNFDLLIRAVDAMQGRQAAQLVLLGDGADRARLVRLARDLGIADRVYMPGFVADPAPWYRRAAVHAITSESEGFGNTIVESLGTGTPVVSARCIGAPAELLGHGRYGAIVARDAEAMSVALVGAIRQPPDSAELVARAALFSMDVCLDRYETMIAAMTSPCRIEIAGAEPQRLA